MPRNNDPIFWPSSETELDLKRQKDQNYQDSINILQSQWFQADTDQRFALGDQDLWDVLYPGQFGPGRKFNFNLINSFIQMVSGHQRRNRKTTVAIPSLPSMQKTADQLTKCLFHVHKDGLYHKYSDCFEMGALTQGIGLMSFFQDYSRDPVCGETRGRYVDFKSLIIDPYFRNMDLSDCRYIWTRQFFGKEECARFYPHLADEILSMPPGQYRDDKFYFMPESYQLQFPNVIAFDEYWYLSERNCEYILDTETEELQEFHGDEEDKRDIVRMFGQRLKFITKPKPTTRRCVSINDRTIVDEPNPYGIDRYPYAACFGYFAPDTPYYSYKFRGIVRDLRDAQYLYTRRKLADLDILESQQQGLKVKQGALVTPKDSFNRGNGKVLSIAKGYEMSDVEQMAIRPPDPTMLQMEEMLKETMHRIAGIDPAAMGLDVDDKAGIISMLRQASTTQTLTKLFDNMDLFQQQCGEIIIDLIQHNWTYGKVQQVIGEEPTAEFDNKAFSKYGIKIVQGALTETQEQLQLQQLLYFRETTGIPIPSKVILEASTLQNKDDLIEAVMEEEQQAAEAQKQMQQLEMQQLDVDNRTKLAYANSQDGLAEERRAKIVLDKALNAERLQRANEDKTAAILNLVKAAKELEGMDLAHLQKQVEIASQVQENIQTRQELSQDAVDV